MDDEVRCAVVARGSEPLPGTAAVAPRWILVEDHGPWGRDALQDGRLPATVAAHLSEGIAAHGVRYQAIRRPDRTRRATRAVFLANVAAGWMTRQDLPVEDLVHVDLASVTGDEPPDGARIVTDRLVAVCTHGTRDACCAVWGRPVVNDLAERGGDAVWETSHTGGHRFAPSVLVFPTGAVHGRVTDVASFFNATVAGRIDLATYRGNSAHPPPAQVADVVVRQRLGLTEPGDVVVVGTEVEADRARVHARHRDPAGWSDTTVLLTRRHLPDAPVSCGGAPVARSTWQVTALHP